jgi:hypothetical protein
VGTGNTAITNLAYGNGAGDFGTGSAGAGLSFSDSISVLPGFLTDGSNYRLGPSSPAVNRAAGTYSPADDFDGRARPQGAAPDIGAFEY